MCRTPEGLSDGRQPLPRPHQPAARFLPGGKPPTPSTVSPFPLLGRWLHPLDLQACSASTPFQGSSRPHCHTDVPSPPKPTCDLHCHAPLGTDSGSAPRAPLGLPIPLLPGGPSLPCPLACLQPCCLFLPVAAYLQLTLSLGLSLAIPSSCFSLPDAPILSHTFEYFLNHTFTLTSLLPPEMCAASCSGEPCLR